MARWAGQLSRLCAVSTEQPGAGGTVAVPERNGTAHARLGTWGSGRILLFVLLFVMLGDELEPQLFARTGCTLKEEKCL